MLAKALLLLSLSAIFLLLAFETIYRFQILDTYLPELRSFNDRVDLESYSNRNTILVLGDSFSAGTTSYPETLRLSQNTFGVINSSIPGTGIIEAAIVAPRRFEKFRPSILIYQIYLGNDLADISYPVNWREVPFVRNIYWTIAQNLRSLRFLNYRLGQLYYSSKGTPSEARSANLDVEEGRPFSVEGFDPREKTLLKANPLLIENQILLKGDRQRDYELFLRKLEELLRLCADGECEAYLLVLPHPCQVDKQYLDHMKLLGARFTNPDEIISADYPFITGLKNFLEELGYKNTHLLNPIYALREKEVQGVGVYYQNNSHLNRAGQKVLSEYLLRELGLSR